MNKVCPTCHKTFDSNRFHRKYCSDACFLEAKRKRDRQWKADHREYCKKYSKERRNKQEISLKTCPVCGTEFTPHHRQKYCSDSCAKEAQKTHCREWMRAHSEHVREVQKKYRERNRKPPAEITCPVCGKTFIKSYHNRKYCSDECKIQGLKNNRKKWRDNNPEKVKLMREKRKTKYKETVRRCNRNYYLRHQEECKDRQKKFYEEHKEKRHEYYLRHKRKYERREKVRLMTIQECATEHDNCFSCPTRNGECLYD